MYVLPFTLTGFKRIWYTSELGIETLNLKP